MYRISTCFANFTLVCLCTLLLLRVVRKLFCEVKTVLSVLEFFLSSSSDKRRSLGLSFLAVRLTRRFSLSRSSLDFLVSLSDRTISRGDLPPTRRLERVVSGCRLCPVCFRVNALESSLAPCFRRELFRKLRWSWLCGRTGLFLLRLVSGGDETSAKFCGARRLFETLDDFFATSRFRPRCTSSRFSRVWRFRVVGTFTFLFMLSVLKGSSCSFSWRTGWRVRWTLVWDARGAVQAFKGCRVIEVFRNLESPTSAGALLNMLNGENVRKSSSAALFTMIAVSWPMTASWHGNWHELRSNNVNLGPYSLLAQRLAKCCMRAATPWGLGCALPTRYETNAVQIPTGIGFQPLKCTSCTSHAWNRANHERQTLAVPTSQISSKYNCAPCDGIFDIRSLKNSSFVCHHDCRFISHRCRIWETTSCSLSHHFAKIRECYLSFQTQVANGPRCWLGGMWSAIVLDCPKSLLDLICVEGLFRGNCIDLPYSLARNE